MKNNERMQSAMRLNAKGIKVMLSGRLAGNEIARTEWLREGSIPSAIKLT